MGDKMTRITVVLRDDERRALIALSEKQRRPPREQAAWLIRKQLEALGVLAADDRPAQEVHHAQAG